MADAAAARLPSSGFLVALGNLAAAGNVTANGGGIPGLSLGAALLAAGALICTLKAMPPRPADAADWACFTAALALAATPARPGALAALILLALPCLRGGSRGSGTGLLLLAAGGFGLLEPLGSGLLAAPVMATEARGVVALLQLGGAAAEASGNLVSLPEARHMLLILRGCSALVLLPEVALATLALAQLLRPSAAAWRAMGLAVAAALLLNLTRLVAMAVSVRVAEALHTEWGLAGLQLLWTAVALVSALLATRRN